MELLHFAINSHSLPNLAAHIQVFLVKIAYAFIAMDFQNYAISSKKKQ